MTNIFKKLCVYCQAPDPSQRYDYAGNAAGVMCDRCWTTSALNQVGIEQQGRRRIDYPAAGKLIQPHKKEVDE